MTYNLILGDAPGWAHKQQHQHKNPIHPSSLPGPSCWKCQGTTKAKKKKKQKIDDKSCTVCSGKGYIPAKKKEIIGKNNPGVITRRSRYHGTPSGPLPFSIRNKSCKGKYFNEAVSLVENAVKDNIHIPSEGNYPNWIPRNGEELVNLVGSWRILQCVGSHRWTTDDLVTAYVASYEFSKYENNATLKYCDLGCGNGSVLQMTTWKLLQKFNNLECVGIEARSEAYNLAKRSLCFNVGPHDDENALCKVQLRNHDFRVLLEGNEFTEHFDFITGTPPYFKIEYSSTDTSNANAIIKQGGMPTCLQSAPARCEFRGGVEAYCQVAAKLMKPNGTFVAVEAWIHHARVIKAAKSFGLAITFVQPIRGKIGKPPLFGVYVMQKSTDNRVMEILPHVAVRDGCGKWTDDYCKILKHMAIPT